MGSGCDWVIRLAAAAGCSEALIGGKAARLAQLAHAGYRLPYGFVITACAIVERRGGMLIHGAIIARELGIPCVNGVAGAVDRLPEGELVTVDGYLGIVTIGPPEFDLEVRG